MYFRVLWNHVFFVCMHTCMPRAGPRGTDMAVGAKGCPGRKVTCPARHS